MRSLSPPEIHPPFANYSHAVDARCERLIAISGQLGVRANGDIPEGAEAQSEVCFKNLDAILNAAEVGREHVVRVNAYVTDRCYMAGYMKARDAYFAACAVKPASTLVIVAGFARPECVVEIEMLAVEEP